MKLHNILIALSIASFTCLTGCVKFDDPEVIAFTEPVTSSPCTALLTDNFSAITSGNFDIGSFTFTDPSCVGNALQTNPNTGNFDIDLGSAITSSGIYSLEFFPTDNEASLSFNLPGQPTYTANGGNLYINFNSDGTKTIEWCNITCQSVGSNLKSEGRIICTE